MTPAQSRETSGGESAQRSSTEPDTPQVDPTAATGSAPSNESSREDLIEVRSPMVGTFYRASSPTSPPFVEVGGVVSEDDPLCLIEVMKLYTTISANGPGRVIEICAENGAMVGADETLFRIEPL